MVSRIHTGKTITSIQENQRSVDFLCWLCKQGAIIQQWTVGQAMEVYKEHLNAMNNEETRIETSD